jgi:hypothetical protein
LFEIPKVTVAAELVTLDATMLPTLITVPEAGVKPVKETEPLVFTSAYVHATDTEVEDGIT